MEERNNFEFIEQFAFLVLDYSSQYGSPNGHSYVASNIAGPPSRYPLYGDFPETFVPRTYGPWWQCSPCAPPTFAAHQSSKRVAQDFIDVYFQSPVYPFCISVYETYNPGCVLRLWAGNGNGTWKLLYEAKTMKSGQRATVFAPHILSTSFLTSVIRVELDSRVAEYYPELDAIFLVGTLSDLSLNEPCLGVRGLTHKIKALGLHLVSSEINILENIKNIGNQIANFTNEKNLPLDTASREGLENYCLDQLPAEILREIFSYLDLESLCCVARVCKSFSAAARDPLLFSEVNLKPYWSKCSSSTLEWLSGRSRLLQKLDLSWCGSYGVLTTADFTKFICWNGTRLRVLRLDNCSFVHSEALYKVSVSCPLLQELSLKGCRNLAPCSFWHICRLSRIERLNLEETRVELPSLLAVLQSLRNLKYLTLGSCVTLMQEGAADEIVHWLSYYQPELKMLDLWRHLFLSPQGMGSLIKLTHLEELDIGWCGLPSNGGWVTQLVRNCRNLKKLFLTAVRIVTDSDLMSIATSCTQIEQLDILGNSLISPEGCLRILQSCRRLKLLDVSYCSQIEEHHVNQWRLLYPSVSIKRSCMPSD